MTLYLTYNTKYPFNTTNNRHSNTYNNTSAYPWRQASLWRPRQQPGLVLRQRGQADADVVRRRLQEVALRGRRRRHRRAVARWKTRRRRRVAAPVAVGEVVVVPEASCSGLRGVPAAGRLALGAVAVRVRHIVACYTTRRELVSALSEGAFFLQVTTKWNERTEWV